MVIFGVATFWYWFLKKRSEPLPLPPFPQEQPNEP